MVYKITVLFLWIAGSCFIIFLQFQFFFSSCTCRAFSSHSSKARSCRARIFSVTIYLLYENYRYTLTSAVKIMNMSKVGNLKRPVFGFGGNLDQPNWKYYFAKEPQSDTSHIPLSSTPWGLCIIMQGGHVLIMRVKLPRRDYPLCSNHT